MSVAPDRRLVLCAAAWSAGSVLAVVWPALWPVQAGALGVLVALALWDARLVRRTPPVTLRRTLPARASVGRDATVAVQLRNDAEATVEIDVLDEVTADVAGAPPSFIAARVPPRATAVLDYTICPTVRGDRPFGPLVGLARSPLGFFRRCTMAGATDVLRVYPDATRFLRPQALDPKRVFAAIGVRPARRRGEGMEFESLRDYVPGDDPWRIDWAATARRGRAVTRLYEHERHRTVVIALDASRLMAGEIDGRTKLDHAVDGALALAYGALACGDRVGMVVFDREERGHLTPRGQRRSLGLFVELLRAVEPRTVEADYRVLVRSLAVRQRRRALVVVLTDFVEADPAALVDPLVLLAGRHRVLLVAIRDRVYDTLSADNAGGEEHPLDLYRRIVLDELLREREATLTRLRRSGLQTLDLPPAGLTSTLLNRYLAIRYGSEQ